MKNKLFLFILMSFFMLSHQDMAVADEKKATSENAAAQSGRQEPLSPFDIKAEKLPPNYRGTDIVALYSMLLGKAPLVKGEFETTADYENKIRAAVTDDVYAFFCGRNIFPYNADTEKFDIKLLTMPLNYYTSNDYRAYMRIKTIPEGSRSHVGSNAFGAEVLVKEERNTIYGIALVNQKDFGTSNDDDRPSGSTVYVSLRTENISIAVPPDKAKALKRNIGALCLCKPMLYEPTGRWNGKRNRLILEDTAYSEATMNYPLSYIDYRKFINVEVISIWVYEISSGKIILKKDVKGKE